MDNIILSDNSALKTYLLHSSFLILKMLLMSILTVGKRFKNKVFISPEDTVLRSGANTEVNESVERVRRAHLNDLENVPAFILICGIYILTDPVEAVSSNLIRVYTVIRILHTFVYAVIPIPQPTRAIIWTVGYLITIYMVFASIVHFISYI